jgi:K+-transporting ATPase ATPase C chain
MKTYIIPAVRLLIVLTLVTGAAYPLALTIFGYAVFATQAHGSIILRDGKAVGSSLIGQTFTSPAYFHSRPSAIEYNPLPSSGTNFGPTSAALRDSVAARRIRFAEENGLLQTSAVPAEMLFASGSGLDPHISPESAMMQAARIGRARHMAEGQIIGLVIKETEQPDLGLLGQPRVNVLRLNCALDDMTHRQGGR